MYVGPFKSPEGNGLVALPNGWTVSWRYRGSVLRDDGHLAGPGPRLGAGPGGPLYKSAWLYRTWHRKYDEVFFG